MAEVSSLDLRSREEATYNPPAYFNSAIKLYHGSQELFNKLSLETVEKLVVMFKEALRENTDFDAAFFKCCDFLIKERSIVAKRQGHQEPHLFRWMNDKNGSDALITTLIGTQYQPYGDKVIKMIQGYLNLIVQQKGEDLTTGNYGKGWGKGDSRYYVRVVNKRELFEMLKCKGIYLLPLWKSADGVKVFHPFLSLALESIPQENPMKMQVDDNFQPIKNAKDRKEKALVMGATVQKIDGQWLTLSLQLAWLHLEHPMRLTRDDIQYMGQKCFLGEVSKDDGTPILRRNSQFIISHGFKGNIPLVIKDVGRLVKRALLWDRKNKQDLLGPIAEAQFKLNQQTPWERGGGNIPENIAKAIFKFHGFELVPNAKDVNMFFESHVHPICILFQEVYPKLYAVDPTSKPIKGARAVEEAKEDGKG